MFVYMAAYPVVQEVAATLGYSIAVHGSMVSDFDLIAAPWVESAAPPEVLVEAIRSAYAHLDESDPNHNIGVTIHGPEQKPHGRLAWCIMFGAGLYIDISVLPRLPKWTDTPVV